MRWDYTLQTGLAMRSSRGSEPSRVTKHYGGSPMLAGYIAAYIVVILLANLMATDLIEFPGGVVVAVGTLWFGATFTLRDWVHQYCYVRGLGKRPIYLMIGLAAAVSGIVAIYTGGEAFAMRIVLASVVAVLLAESADTEVYHALIRRNYYVRVTSSNLISAPLDSVLFVLIAFYGASYFPQELLVPVIIGDTLAKWVIASGLMFTKPARDALGRRWAITPA